MRAIVLKVPTRNFTLSQAQVVADITYNTQEELFNTLNSPYYVRSGFCDYEYVILDITGIPLKTISIECKASLKEVNDD